VKQRLIGLGFLGAMLFSLAGFDASIVIAQPKTPKVATFSHAHVLKVRKVGETKWEGATAFGVEVYKDENNTLPIYLTETGNISVGGPPANSNDKGPKWQYGHEFPVRKGTEEKFSKETRRVSLEVFKDENNGAMMYIGDNGTISSVNTGDPKTKDKGPKRVHSMYLLVRKSNEKNFTDKTHKMGIEIYSDENNGNLIYSTETGHFAVSPRKIEGDGKKQPKWSHGLLLKARRSGEIDWKTAKEYSVEVFSDENTGSLLYVSETGSIAVVEGGKITLTDKKPTWFYDLELAARKADEEKITAKTKRFGLEVFRDENTGNLVYITDTGSISVIPGK
jgi:hypothetical protein